MHLYLTSQDPHLGYQAGLPIQPTKATKFPVAADKLRTFSDDLLVIADDLE